MRFFRWLVEVVLEALLADKFEPKWTRRSARVIAREKAGHAVLGVLGMVAICMLWATLGPSAGNGPYVGLPLLIHWVDLMLLWSLLFFVVIAALLNLHAWSLRP